MCLSDMKIGDQIPNITLPDQDRKDVNLAGFKGVNPLVIYFYPKDETPGCTMEACSFRDQYEDFTDVGAKVFGISTDSVGSHKRFAMKYNLNFQLLSDRRRDAEKTFGVKRGLLGLLPGRVTFVFNQQGELIHQFDSVLQPAKHISEALEALKASVPA